jgi:hypothetical protein
MAAHKKYPDELRERAVRMVFEIRERDGKGHGEIAQVVRLAAVGRRDRWWRQGRSAHPSRGWGWRSCPRRTRPTTGSSRP